MINLTVHAHITGHTHRAVCAYSLRSSSWCFVLCLQELNQPLVSKLGDLIIAIAPRGVIDDLYLKSSLDWSKAKCVKADEDLTTCTTKPEHPWKP